MLFAASVSRAKFMSERPMKFHRDRRDLQLRLNRLQILNNFVFEFVFCR